VRWSGFEKYFLSHLLSNASPYSSFICRACPHPETKDNEKVIKDYLRGIRQPSLQPFITGLETVKINSDTMCTFTVQNGAVFELTKTEFLDRKMPKTLSSVLSGVVEAKSEYDLRLLAQQLGTSYRSLMYWLRGDRHVPAYLLPRICTLLGNYETLDLLESQAGRVAFRIPDPKQTSEEEFKAISALIKDVGEALESIANTLADGVVEENELAITVPKLEAVIQECASLKYWLEDLHKRKKKKKK